LKTHIFLLLIEQFLHPGEEKEESTVINLTIGKGMSKMKFKPDEGDEQPVYDRVRFCRSGGRFDYFVISNPEFNDAIPSTESRFASTYRLC
jgi:hypothetical protein